MRDNLDPRDWFATHALVGLLAAPLDSLRQDTGAESSRKSRVGRHSGSRGGGMSRALKYALTALELLVLLALLLFAGRSERKSLWDESRKHEAPPSYHGGQAYAAHQRASHEKP
jgi:hypothetical protein